MSINASWLRMFVEMRKRHNFGKGDVLALGVQDVMFNHETAESLLQERNAKFSSIPAKSRRYSLSRNQRQFTDNPNYYASVQDIFRMLGFSSLSSLDAFDNDKPDIKWDLSEPIPQEFHNRSDLVFDIGVLEHVADIFQALENVGNLAKPDGWIFLYLPMVSPINTCMYHPNPPFYFDILSANGFHNFDAWINWMPDWNQQNDIRTIWLNYKYNDDVFIWRPRFFTVMAFIAQKHQYVREFKPVLQNFYKEWHAGDKLLGTTQEDLLQKQAGLSDIGAIEFSQSRRSAFARAVISGLTGRRDRGSLSPWLHPTAQSMPSAGQLARFPINDYGVPFAREVVIAPVDSAPQRDIPEQMLVGDPPREQLYL